MSDTLVINEIYLSVQGESTWAGLPCVFIRLTACNLRCSYCDTAYAFTEGKEMTLPEILQRVHALAKPFASRQMARPQPPPAGGLGRARLPPSVPSSNAEMPPAAPRLPLVELTGGEPLWQKNSLPLMRSLCDAGFSVLLETSGALDIAPVDARVRRIMDLKCPGSGESKRNRWQNLAHLRHTDEVKFVISTREDYDWAKQIVLTRNLAEICPVLFSWASPLLPRQRDKSLREAPAGQVPISRQELAEQILADALPVRFQLQMHKFIWPPDQKGV